MEVAVDRREHAAGEDEPNGAESLEALTNRVLSAPS
jgi:hypothetical protein